MRSESGILLRAAPSRRALLKMGALGAAGTAMGAGSGPVRLFDGKTLNGWIQVEIAATTLPYADISDVMAFARKITSGSDAVTVYLRGRMQDSVKDAAAAYIATGDTTKAANSAVARVIAKEVTQILAGPSIYDEARFRGVTLRPETARLLKRKQTDAARLNKMLLEDAYASELHQWSGPGWVVKDGAMASTGSGRGVIYTEKDCERFRLLFTMRHVSGNPDHQACVIIYGTRPPAGERAVDALAGIQFQPPNGGRWDYRPGKNNNGGDLFTRLVNPGYDPHEWSCVEIVADASKGTARMAVAQPIGSKAVEVLRFEDSTAGKVGPIAWQMHNAGLFDEFKDVTIEANPKDNGLSTVG
ncbi:MAG: DUF1080 domain-containing protein [Acidobacteriota bacterium]